MPRKSKQRRLNELKLEAIRRRRLSMQKGSNGTANQNHYSNHCNSMIQETEPDISVVYTKGSMENLEPKKRKRQTSEQEVTHDAFEHPVDAASEFPEGTQKDFCYFNENPNNYSNNIKFIDYDYDLKPNISALGFLEATKKDFYDLNENQNDYTNQTNLMIEETKPDINVVDTKDTLENLQLWQTIEQEATQVVLKDPEDTDSVFSEVTQKDFNYFDENSNDYSNHSKFMIDENKPYVSVVNTDDNVENLQSRQTSEQEVTQDGLKDPVDPVSGFPEATRNDFCALYCDLLALKLRCFDDKTCDILMNEIDNLVFRYKMK